MLLAAAAGTCLAAPTSTTPVPSTSPAATPPGAHAVPHADACMDSRVERAIRLVASQAADPGAAALTMRFNLAQSHFCFPDDLTDEQLFEILTQYQALPPTVVWDGGLRFLTTSSVWTADVSIGTSGRAQRARLTFSFVPDGANWDGVTNTLNATLTTNFGAGNEDRGREYMRQALAAWTRHAGLVYQEVADNGSNRSSSATRSVSRGDIRIGGNARGTPNYLAYNYFPSGGGDMLINTSYFNPGSNMGNSSNNYRYLRNVVAHEQGHGLGYNHVVPCTGTKLMEPFINTSFETVVVDERRGAGRNYGDRYSGNNAAATAINLGELATPAPRSVVERDLTTNGSAGAFGTNADWFRFTLSTPQPVVISAVPTGGSYPHGAQESNCEGTQTTVNALNAGNLNIELRNSSGAVIVQSSAVAPAGQAEILTVPSLAAGEYTLRIFDAGPNPTADLAVQLYDMNLRVGAGAGGRARPQAVAGVNKRIAANTNCFFMGNINSRALEPGATIPASGYAWDLDGDGTFEVVSAQPIRQYPSNGVYNVTLRVTDSFGSIDTDTITVTVVGAASTITGISPSTGDAGQTVPITITGTNLLGLTAPSMVTFAGGGITVTGTPVPNAMGTSVSGLSLVISAGAAPGVRDFTVTTPDGAASGIGLFTVEAGAPECPADWNNDTLVNSSDISAFLTTWLGAVTDGTLDADANNDGVTNSSDISAFLTLWLDGVTNGC